MKSNIAFKNHKKETLRGILHEPNTEDSIREHIVIFPNGGLMGCEGDFRAYIRIADVLVSHGFFVMRFSPSGIGLSDGYIEDCKQKDLFGIIETGLFVDDFKAAINYIANKYPSFDITLAGICGGSISALLSAPKSDKVKNVVAISTPITLDKASLNYSKKMSKEQAKFLFSTYIYKMLSPKAWLRLISFRSDNAAIKTILKYLLVKNTNAKDQEELKNSLNPNFFEAAKNILDANKNILFIYGDSDRAMWEFEKYFMREYVSDNQKAPFGYFRIKNGNHMLTWVEMQNQASKKMVEWLNNCDGLNCAQKL